MKIQGEKLHQNIWVSTKYVNWKKYLTSWSISKQEKINFIKIFYLKISKSLA